MKTSQTSSTSKKKVAVFLGGRSPEHDVSVVSGLQAFQAIDRARFEPFVVYIATDGKWYVGESLHSRENFMPSAEAKKALVEVTLDTRAGRGGNLLPVKSGFLGNAKPIAFDIAIPAFHGLYGEDGQIQGAFELANIPYTGMRTKASSILMDKATTKLLLKALDIPYLPYAVLHRPESGYLIPEEEIESRLKPLGYPCILKPVHLGSSIGVAKVNNAEEVRACLPAIFEYDTAAIAEPFVENLVEYNVAVSKANGKPTTSAIERPKTSQELLDFKEKYLSGGGTKGGAKSGGTKTPGASSEGMLSLTRDINPELPQEIESNIRTWGERLFIGIDGTGAPRIDFISNKKTGEVWLNEVNPCPGSFGYFLWEAAKNPVLFTDLLGALLDEATLENAAMTLPRDPVPADARLLKRA